jgi:hypothetical protein
MAAGALKLALLPPVLIALAGSVVIMGYALAKLGELPMKQIIQGFGALLGILGALQIFMIIDKHLGGMSLTSGLGMVAIAISLTILAKAISMFSDIELGTMGKAAGAVGGLLLIVGLLSKAKSIGPQMLILGISITGIAASLVVLALAFKYLGAIDFSTIATGLANVLVMLGAIYFANFVGGGIKLAGIGKLALMALAVAGLGAAFLIIAQIDAGKVLLASTAIGLSVAILYGAVSLIKPDIIDNIGAFLVLSAGLAAFALALSLFKNVDFKAVLLGGAALGVLVVILLALGALVVAFPPLEAALLAVAATLLIAGVGFMAFGTGVLFAGTGVRLFAEGLVLLAEGGTKMIDSFIKSIPKLGDAIVAFALAMPKAIVRIYPTLYYIGTVMIVTMCTAIIAAVPYITKAFIVIVGAILDTLYVLGPKLYNTVALFLMTILVDLEKNIGTYANLFNRIQIKLLNAMSKTAVPVVKAWFNYFITITGGLADTIDKDGGKLRANMNRLAKSMIKFLLDGFAEAVIEIDKTLYTIVKYIAGGLGKETVARFKDFIQIGKYVVAGLIMGLLDPTGFINMGTALDSFITWMLNRLRNGVAGNSSTQQGSQIGASYVQSVADGIDPSKVKTKLDSVKEAMLSFMDGSLATNLNFQPTLSPVLDMGAMSSIEKTISSAFGPQQFDLGMSPGFSLARSPAGLVAPGPYQAQTVYNQYNTSASPLSVEEVARRTHSLIGQNRRQ